MKQHTQEFGSCYENVAQGYSNIDGVSRTTVYESWAQQVLFGDRLRIKIGKVDANTEFAVVQTSADFLNSSMGYSPTINALPSYPEPRPGIDVSYGLAKRYHISAGIFQAEKDARMLLVEATHNWVGGASDLSGRISLGYWVLHGNSQSSEEAVGDRDEGLYGVFEQLVWHRPLHGEADREQKISLFIQLGSGNDNSRYAYHAGAGLTMDSPFRHRVNDGAGVAVSWVRLNGDLSTNLGGSSEVVFEAYYKSQMSQHFALVYDMQHYPRSNGSAGNSTYLVANVRSLLTF
jgi:carbohydrate-selective porin OprB